jgi:hypothetical protein
VHLTWKHKLHYHEEETAHGAGVKIVQKRQRWIDAIVKDKIVVIQKDAIDPDTGNLTCDGYDSVWRVDNVQVTESGLVNFDFVEQLAWCY